MPMVVGVKTRQKRGRKRGCTDFVLRCRNLLIVLDFPIVSDVCALVKLLSTIILVCPLSLSSLLVLEN